MALCLPCRSAECVQYFKRKEMLHLNETPTPPPPIYKKIPKGRMRSMAHEWLTISWPVSKTCGVIKGIIQFYLKLNLAPNGREIPVSQLHCMGVQFPKSKGKIVKKILRSTPHETIFLLRFLNSFLIAQFQRVIQGFCLASFSPWIIWELPFAISPLGLELIRVPKLLQVIHSVVSWQK